MDKTILPHFWTRVNLLAITVILSLIAWAGFAVVDESVKGTGRTISAGENRVIQHLEGGILSEILVHEGQTVKKGQSLFRVQNANLSAGLKENEVQIRALAAKVIRLTAEAENKPLVFSDDLKKALPDVVNSELRLYDSRVEQRRENIRILEQQIAQKQSTLNEQQAKLGNLRSELATSREQYTILQKLSKSGAASTSRTLEAEGKVGRFQTELSSLQNTIPVTRAELSEAIGRLQETRARLQNEVLEELNKTTLEGRQLAERMKAGKDSADRTDIRAPVDGIVNRLYLHTIGGAVRPAEPLAEITPSNESVIVEAKIAPEHRAKIWYNQPVKVKITAFESSTYGMATGHVQEISADSFFDEAAGRAYYRVKIALDQKPSGKQAILPGMMTEVHILAGKHTVLEYLLKPLKRAQQEAFREG